MLMKKETLNKAFTVIRELQDQTAASGSRVVLKAVEAQLKIVEAALVLAAWADGHFVEALNGNIFVGGKDSDG